MEQVQLVYYWYKKKLIYCWYKYNTIITGTCAISILLLHAQLIYYWYKHNKFITASLYCNSVTTPILAILSYLYKKIAHLMPIFFSKNVTFVASKLSDRVQFIFCLWSMCTNFSHNFKSITQNGQNHICDTGKSTINLLLV